MDKKMMLWTLGIVLFVAFLGMLTSEPQEDVDTEEILAQLKASSQKETVLEEPVILDEEPVVLDKEPTQPVVIQEPEPFVVPEPTTIKATNPKPPSVALNEEVVVSSSSIVVSCDEDEYNCGDFSSCTEVMAVFDACPTDINQLDGDDDGTPCENLCGSS